MQKKTLAWKDTAWQATGQCCDDFGDGSAHAAFWERWVTKPALGLLSQNTNLPAVDSNHTQTRFGQAK